MPPKMISLTNMPTSKKRSADEIAGLDKSNKPPNKRQAFGTNIVRDAFHNAVKVPKDHDSKLSSPSTSNHKTIDLSTDDEDSSGSSEGEPIPKPLITLKNFREPRESLTQFCKGDIYIKLNIGAGISNSLRIHAKDLNRASQIIKDMLKSPVDEPDPNMAQEFKSSNGITNRLELVYDTASKLYVLTRASLTVDIEQRTTLVPARGSAKPAGSNISGHAKRATSKPEQVSISQQHSSGIIDPEYSPFIPPIVAGTEKKKASKILPQHDGPADLVGESPIEQEISVKEEEIEKDFEAERTGYTALANSSTKSAADVTMADGHSVKGEEFAVKQEGAESSASTYDVGDLPITVVQDAETKNIVTMLEGAEDAASAHIEEHGAINGQDAHDYAPLSPHLTEEVLEIDEPIPNLDEAIFEQDGIKTTSGALEMTQSEWPTTTNASTSTQLRSPDNKIEKKPTEKRKADFQNHNIVLNNVIVIDDDADIEQSLSNKENSEAIKQHVTSKLEIQTENMSPTLTVQNTADKLARDTARTDHAASKAGKKEETIIKQKNPHQRVVSASEDNHQLSKDYFAAYENLFLVYCNKPPITPLNNINELLRQAEILVRLSQYYKSGNLIPTHIRLYLSHAFNHYDRDMRVAILVDPPRWLTLAMQLESAPMFKEAAIHIVANFPSVPWATRLNEILHRRKVHNLFKRKSEELKSLKTSIDASLIKIGIECEGEVVRISFHSAELYHISTVINMWRDWYLDGINQAEEDDQANSKIRPLTNAKMYRELAGHPAEYLRLDTVLKAVQAQKGEERLTEVEQDEITTSLHLMKRQARQLVASLCVNKSTLPVGEFDIQYFTCIKIEDDELPWMEKDDN